MNRPVRNFLLLVILVFLSGLTFSSAQEKVYAIDTVRITAPKEYRSLLKEPYTEPFSLLPVISKVTLREIRQQGAVNVIEAMGYVTGGLTETRGRQVKQFFSVRGQKYPYPDYALNGIWQQEFEELPYFFSASDIEKIEIVRSSAALLSGLSGIEGLINIKTREYTTAGTDLELEYGAFNSVHSHLSTGNRIGKFMYAAGAGYDRTDGPAGKHSSEAMGTFYTRMNWDITPELTVLGSLYYLEGKRDLRIAEPPADSRYIAMVQKFDPFRAALTNLKFIYRPGKRFSTELQLFYSFRDPKFRDEIAATSSSEKDIETGLNFMQTIAVSDNNTIRIGALYDKWRAPNGKRFYTGKECNTETFSGVIVDEHRLGRFTLDAGIRWTKIYLIDYAAFNIQGEGGQFKNVTPVHDQWEPATLQGSFGISYNTSDSFSVNFNSAAGQIKPRAGTLDINFRVPLDETRLKLDLGVVKQFTGNSGKLIMTAFGVFQKSAIALSGTTFTDSGTGQVRELYINRGQNQTGLEFEIYSPEIVNMFQPFFNITVMKSEMAEGGEMVRNRENPAVISGAGILFEKKNIDLNLFGKYVSYFENIRFAPKNAGPQPLGEYFSFDFNGGYTLKGKFPARLYLRIKNISDRRYSTVVGYPDFGRMIYLGLRLSLAGKPEKG